MAREENAMITYDDARYMVANEDFSSKQYISSSNECMVKSEINKYLLYESDLSDYDNNQLVPYQMLSPHFWQFISTYYKMNNTSGGVIDHKGGKNAVISGDVLRGQVGKVGNAFKINDGGFSVGNSNFFDFSSNGANHKNSFVTWVKFLDSGSYSIFHNSVSSIRWTFKFETVGSDLVVKIKGGDNQSINTNYIGRKVTNFDFKIGSWQLLGFSYFGTSSSDSLEIYQNSIQVDNSNANSGSYGTAINSGATVRFFYGNSNASLNGFVDDTLFLKKYAMKKNDYEYLYNNGAGRILTPPTTV